MKGAVSWADGLSSLHSAQADISVLPGSFPRYSQKLGPLSDNFASRLAPYADPHLDDTLQGAEAPAPMHHLSRNSSDEHLTAYPARGSQHSLPTVAEDDIFSAVGGLELGLGDARQRLGETAHTQHASALQDQHNGDASRTLIIRNVASDVPDEELRSIFQAFGDVRQLHSTLKPQGIIVVTYYDLRAATNAVATLNGTLIQNVPISVTFADMQEKELGNTNQGTMMFHDSDNSNEHLVWLFSKFGAVKGICEAPGRPSQKFITFYDVRHASAAMRALNRSAEALNKVPGQLTAQQVAALQPSVSAPNLLQLGQLSSQLTATEPTVGAHGKRPSGLWDNSPSSSAVESLVQLAKHHNPSRMSQVHSHHNLASAALAAMEAPSPASLLANASRHGSHQDLQTLSSELQQSSPTPPQAPPLGVPPPQQPQPPQQQRTSGSGRPSQSNLSAAAPQFTGYGGMDALAMGMGGMHLSSPSPASGNGGPPMGGLGRRGSPLSYPSRTGSAQGGMMGGMAMPGFGLPPLPGMYGGADPAALLAGGYDFAGMGPEAWMGYGMSASGPMGLPYPPFPPAAMPPFPPGSAGMPLPGFPDLTPQQQAQMFAQMQAQQAAMMGGPRRTPSPAPMQAAAAQFLQQQQQSPQGALPRTSASMAAMLQQAGMGGLPGMGLPPAAAAAAAASMPPPVGFGGMPGMGLPGMGGGGPGMGGSGVAGGGSHHHRASGSGHGRGGHHHHHHHHAHAHGHGGPGAGGEGMGRNGGRLSRRTTDPQAELERKAQQEKLYALNPEKIQRGEDRRTTLMIKNIPNKYTQKMLLATVDEHFKGTYDFFYLPIDFKNKCNVGYAFINMVNPIDIIPLMQRFNNRKWERFNSEKVCSISYARIQGRAALVQHFQNSSLMHEDKRCRPILFTVEDNATGSGEQEAFPAPSNSTSSTGANNSLSASASNSHTKLSSLPGARESSSNLAAMAGASTEAGPGATSSTAAGMAHPPTLGTSTSASNLAALAAQSAGGSSTTATHAHVPHVGGSTPNLAALSAAQGSSVAAHAHGAHAVGSTPNLAALAAHSSPHPSSASLAAGGSSSNLVGGSTSNLAALAASAGLGGGTGGGGGLMAGGSASNLAALGGAGSAGGALGGLRSSAGSSGNLQAAVQKAASALAAASPRQWP